MTLTSDVDKQMDVEQYIQIMKGVLRKWRAHLASTTDPKERRKAQAYIAHLERNIAAAKRTAR